MNLTLTVDFRDQQGALIERREYGPEPMEAWRVALVRSSARPAIAIPWLASGDKQIARVEAHESFVRWMSPKTIYCPHRFTEPTGATPGLGQADPSEGFPQ